MKSTETDRFSRIAMSRPFASGTGAAKNPIYNETGTSINYPQGFPTSYSTPVSEGGRFVSRADMNGVVNMATQSQFYFQAGGLNTFDQKFAAAIGGYPEGAVLDYLVGTTLYKVLSLKDDNLVDFTGALPSETGIIQGNVDGENWEYVNMDKPRTTEIDIGKLPEVIPPDTTTFLRSFVAPKDGMVFLNGKYAIAQSGFVSPSSGNFWYGCGLFIKANSTSMGYPTKEVGFNGWTPIFNFTTLWYGNGSSHTEVYPTSFFVTKGTTYSIASACGIPQGESAQGMGDISKFGVSDIDMTVYIV